MIFARVLEYFTRLWAVVVFYSYFHFLKFHHKKSKPVVMVHLSHIIPLYVASREFLFSVSKRKTRL